MNVLLIAPTDVKPCKPSQRYRNARGYPQIRVAGVAYYEHRYVYEQAHGPIPAGLQVDHLCHGWDQTCPGGDDCPHRRCVEITHLEAVTPLVNTLRSRGPSALAAAQTHCKHGHEFTPENTYTRPDNGGRVCRSCSANRVLAGRDRRRLTLAPDDPRHGTANGYTNYMCRCDPCRTAHEAYRKGPR